nr:FAD binding domain-containing protein [Pelagicoccus albus]
MLSAHSGEARVLAGGQSLIPQLNLRTIRVKKLIDANGIEELFGVSVSDGYLHIGAMTRQVDLEEDSAIKGYFPEFLELLPSLGFSSTRNRGTVGGSIAFADPAAELPALALALEGEVKLQSQRTGTRILSVEDFLVGPFKTVAQPDEMLTGIRLPLRSALPRSFVREVNLRSLGRAAAGIIALAPDGETPTATLFAWADRPRKIAIRPPQDHLESTAEQWLESCGLSADSPSWQDDAHGSKAYRIHVFASLLQEAATALALV